MPTWTLSTARLTCLGNSRRHLLFRPLNDIDIFTNDLGFVVIAEADRLLGYNLLAGAAWGCRTATRQLSRVWRM